MIDFDFYELWASAIRPFVIKEKRAFNMVSI